MLTNDKIIYRTREAVRHYWSARGAQGAAQGGTSGSTDYGRRTEVTGGKQLDGFIELVIDILKEGGLKDTEVFSGRGSSEIPGFFRPTKNWDVVAVAGDGRGKKGLIACVEIKSLGGPSFGNNYNNRVEEALGNSADVWKAYEQKILPLFPRPFLGYLMLLEELDGSLSPVQIKSPHFKADKVFDGASYRDRMAVLCERLIRERVYDSAAFIMASRASGATGSYKEPVESLSVFNLAAALDTHVQAFLAARTR